MSISTHWSCWASSSGPSVSTKMMLKLLLFGALSLSPEHFALTVPPHAWYPWASLGWCLLLWFLVLSTPCSCDPECYCGDHIWQASSQAVVCTLVSVSTSGSPATLCRSHTVVLPRGSPSHILDVLPPRPSECRRYWCSGQIPGT